MHPAAAFSRVCRRTFATSNRPTASVFAFQIAACSFRASPPLRVSRDNQQTTENETNDELGHQKYYAISGTGRRSNVKMETNTGHALQTDVPKKMGGQDSAPQPVEHLLAALIGCTQATAIYVGRMMNPRLIIDKICFDIEGYRDERGALELPIDILPTIPARLQCISGTVRVHFRKGAKVSEVQIMTLGAQTEARCPVANMMHASGCVMDIKWVNGNESE
ncbi:hypothetical protein ACHAXR_004661 [Thalassiosira sp. AJA248-18]